MKSTPEWFRNVRTYTRWPQMPNAHGPFGKDSLTHQERESLERIPLFFNVQSARAICEAHALGGRALSYLSFMDTYVHTAGFENGTARALWDPHRPQILLIDRDGRFVNTPMDFTWRMWRYLVCNNTREYVEMALEMVHQQMRNGADGLFIDNSGHRLPCYGHGAPVGYSSKYRSVIAGIPKWRSEKALRAATPEELHRRGERPQFEMGDQEIRSLPRHRHLYPHKGHDYAFVRLLEKVRKVVRSYGPDKVIIVNGTEFAEHADGAMLESYIYSWAWKGKKEDWAAVRTIAAKWQPYIRAGGRPVALSYLGNGTRPVAEDALYACCAATLSGFLWSDYGTCKDPLGHALRRLDLGGRLTPLRTEGGVAYSFFEKGLAAVNGGARRRAVVLRAPADFAPCALRCLAGGQEVARRGGGFRVTVPPRSGRLWLAV